MDLGAVGQQVDGDALRADAVPVVIVVPGLGDLDAGLLGRVGVHDGEVLHLAGVLVHRLLGDAVLDLPALVELGQILKGKGPVARVVRDDGGALNLGAVGQQVDGDALRAETVPVIVVVPGLGDLDAGFLGRVGVGDGLAARRL